MAALGECVCSLRCSIPPRDVIVAAHRHIAHELGQAHARKHGAATGNPDRLAEYLRQRQPIL